MPKNIEVLICDPLSLFREGVRSVLSAAAGIHVAGQARTGLEAVVKARDLNPDVVLMDVSLPLLRGFDAARRIRRADPSICILILTLSEEEELVLKCVEAGAAGYVLKDVEPEQLICAVRTVARGERYFSPRIARFVADAPAQRKTRSGYERLSDREREVLVLLAEGSSLREISGSLRISVKTVDAHKYNIMRKLDLHDRSALIRFAIRQKLIVG